VRRAWQRRQQSKSQQHHLQPLITRSLQLIVKAKLLFEGGNEPVEMGPGDFVNIPAHKRHRVEWTTEEEPTIWLAVFYGKD